MKKNNGILFFLCFLIPIFSSSQNTSNLLVDAVEKLPDEGVVIEQSIKVNNLEELNSAQLDYSPVLYNEGILFTSNRKSQKKSFWRNIFNRKSTNIFFAEKIKEGTYRTAVPLQGKIKGKMNGGAIAVNEEGNLLIYSINDGNDGNDYNSVKLKLYASCFCDGKWSKGAALPINYEGYSTCHPALSSLTKTLYFASNRPGGYGGMDLYKTDFIDGEWGTPINLGPKINTEKNDFFPFVNHDGTLYYASNGKGGNSDLDLYFSRMDKDGEWKEALSLGKPFNSSADDFGFYIEKDGLSGLFSSNREGGIGKDDIYSWRLDQNLEQALDPMPVRFTIFDEITGDILTNAEVSLIEFNDIKFNLSYPESPTAFVGLVNHTIAELLGKHYIYQTDEKGNFFHDLKHDRNYMLVVEKEDYKTFQKMTTYNLLSGIKDIDIALAHPNTMEPEPEYKTIIDLAATEEMDENVLENETNPNAVAVNNELPTEVFERGQKIILNNIYYEFGKSELKGGSSSVLDQTLQMLKNFPEMEINLVSHTDSRGNAAYNKFLSDQRAKAARNYLISKGVEAERVTAIGLGETELLNGCIDGMDCTEDLHSQNRRTEIVITKINPANEIFVKKE